MRDRGFVPRLLLARDLRENDEAPLSPAQTHYLRRVLRLREGDAARVFDGEGAEREAIIVAGKRAWNLKIGAAAASADARFPVVVAQIAGGGARGDWAIEKMCEVGVAAFAPLYRQKPPREAALARWRRIVAAACAQCGRAKLMRIERPQTFAEWIARHRRRAEARFLLTPEAETPLFRGAQNDRGARNTAGMRFGDAVARRRGRLFAGRKTKRARKRIRLRRVGRARFALRNRARRRRRVAIFDSRNRQLEVKGKLIPCVVVSRSRFFGDTRYRIEFFLDFRIDLAVRDELDKIFVIFLLENRPRAKFLNIGAVRHLGIIRERDLLEREQKSPTAHRVFPSRNERLSPAKVVLDFAAT